MPLLPPIDENEIANAQTSREDELPKHTCRSWGNVGVHKAIHVMFDRVSGIADRKVLDCVYTALGKTRRGLSRFGPR